MSGDRFIRGVERLFYTVVAFHIGTQWPEAGPYTPLVVLVFAGALVALWLHQAASKRED